jgi:hypothetical protein
MHALAQGQHYLHGIQVSRGVEQEINGFHKDFCVEVAFNKTTLGFDLLWRGRSFFIIGKLFEMIWQAALASNQRLDYFS